MSSWARIYFVTVTLAVALVLAGCTPASRSVSQAERAGRIEPVSSIETSRPAESINRPDPVAALSAMAPEVSYESTTAETKLSATEAISLSLQSPFGEKFTPWRAAESSVTVVATKVWRSGGGYASRVLWVVGIAPVTWEPGGSGLPGTGQLVIAIDATTGEASGGGFRALPAR